MANFESSWWYALAGGGLIGMASLLAVLVTGKIPGVSGVLARACLGAERDRAWRAAFLVGLIVGAMVAFWGLPAATLYRPVVGLPWVALAGLLVGWGSRTGGGCTSGHGVCGMGMGAKDSMVATLVFMATGMGTVSLTQHLLAL